MTLATRFKARRMELELTQNDISNKLAISQQALQKIESGETLRPRKIEAIAEILKCSPEWLLYGSKDSNISVQESTNLYRAATSLNEVPLISWVQAGGWAEIVDNFHPGDAEEWRQTTAKVSKHAFALRVVGDSMTNPFGSPSIPAGSIVIVDPEAEAINGSIVVARLENSTEATLKKLVIDGNDRLLKPLNPDFSTIQIDEKTTIVGVAKKVEMDL
ncbi:LexA family protein [Marinicellulosiphila megalodicopiae]|uniref:LexA family protein n=1 Tax=Marinicellulosiphila megalodicopiae TaxID=2724896 RepID=UPI003BAED836